jgi:hypothetical protein
MCLLLTSLSRYGSRAPAPNRLAILDPALRSTSGKPERSFASGQDVSDVTNRRRTAVRTHLSARTSVCGSDAFFVSISRRARARARTAFRRLSPWFPGFALHRALPLSCGFVTRRMDRDPFRDRPDLASAGRHSCDGSGSLGRRSPCHGGTQLSLGLFFGCVGRIPGGDPGPLDRCLQLTDLVFKMIARSSRHTPNRTSPRDSGTLGFTPMGSLRRIG